MMGKSAQGLSLNTIVIGAIVLIVLLVLVGIFTGYFSNFVPGFKSASEQKCEGALFSIKENCDELTEQEVFGNFAGKVPAGQKCCKKVDVSCEGAGLICKPVCGSGETKLDKNVNGLAYVCQDPTTSCCLINIP